MQYSFIAIDDVNANPFSLVRGTLQLISRAYR